jgi:hypothetical protein
MFTKQANRVKQQQQQQQLNTDCEITQAIVFVMKQNFVFTSFQTRK